MRSLVRNAADVVQVQRADRLERRRREYFTRALQASLTHPEVRVVFAELLDRAGVLDTVFDPSGSLMYFKEGRRAMGLELRRACEDVAQDLTDLMDNEHRARQRAEYKEIDAAHAAAATGGQDE